MMKNFTFLFLVFAVVSLGFTTSTYAQPWSYDFGTDTGIFNSGESSTFLPMAPSGTARVRIGSGGGSIELENPSTISGFGSGSSLRVAAATGGSVNKYSMQTYGGAALSVIKYNVVFASASGGIANTGNFYFFSGNGTSFTGNGGFTGSQTFTGLRFVYSSNGDITVSRRNGGSWDDTGFSGGNILTQANEYFFEIYSNNTAAPVDYQNGDHTLASYTYDVWINGTKILDNASKAQLANATIINSFMFYGESSTSNAANIYLDDIQYDNTLELELPIDLLSFNATPKNEKVVLDWTYENAIDFERFVVEHSAGDRSWSEIASVDLLAETITTRSNALNAVHDAPVKGANYYRLKMIDLDGSFKYSKVEAVNIDKTGTVRVVNNFVEDRVQLRNEGGFDDITVRITDMQGRQVSEQVLRNMSGTNDISVDVNGVEGMFIMSVEAGGNVESYRMMRR